MALPNQNMDFTALSQLTDTEMDQLVENIESLSDGSGLADDAVTGAKIANYKIYEQNDTTNATLTDALIRQGWGYIPMTTSAALFTKTVTFASAFKAGTIPKVQLTCAGDCLTAAGPSIANGDNNIVIMWGIKTGAITNTGFTVYIYTTDNAHPGANGYVFFNWEAIGQKA